MGCYLNNNNISTSQVPRGCSAVDVVSAIRAKFLTGRREADFVVVCDVRKEASYRLQELNDSQVSWRLCCCNNTKLLMIFFSNHNEFMNCTNHSH